MSQHRDKHSNSQLEELGKAGCSKIYREVASGARSDRPQLHSLLNGLEFWYHLGGHALRSLGSFYN